jgi:hypothetical protein
MPQRASSSGTSIIFDVDHLERTRRREGLLQLQMRISLHHYINIVPNDAEIRFNLILHKFFWKYIPCVWWLLERISVSKLLVFEIKLFRVVFIISLRQ